MRSLALAVLAIAAATASAPAGQPRSTTATYDEPLRPRIHFTPVRNFMNDPNGLVFYKGEYHLFYQHNPQGTTWGHMSWGHAVSTDLLHWKHLPVALAEEDGVMIFSGSAVVDHDDTSGLCRPTGQDRSCLVAIYTGHGHGRQTQNLAVSRDRGRTWTKYAGNPVIDLGLKDFRDPKVFWHAATKRWVMVTVLSDQHKVRFFGSPDLKVWTALSDFGPAGATGGVWECPDLFEVPIEHEPGRTRWVLDVDINPGGPAGGSGGQYFVGRSTARASRATPRPTGSSGSTTGRTSTRRSRSRTCPPGIGVRSGLPGSATGSTPTRSPPGRGEAPSRCRAACRCGARRRACASCSSRRAASAP